MTVYKIDLNSLKPQEYTPKGGDTFLFVDSYDDKTRIAELEGLLREALYALKLEESEDMKQGWEYTRISEITNKIRKALEGKQ